MVIEHPRNLPTQEVRKELMSKVLIGMPNIGGIPPKVASCLFRLAKRINAESVVFLDSSLIYDARNDLALQAINGGFDELLFIDSDIIFPEDCYEKLKALDADIATGIYYGRRGNHNPIIYKEITTLRLTEDGKDFIPAESKPFDEIPEGTFEVKGCGMGMCLIKTKALDEICQFNHNAPFEPFMGLGEDLAFCYRANRLGLTIKANSYIPLGHIGEKVYTVNDYEL